MLIVLADGTFTGTIAMFVSNGTVYFNLSTVVTRYMSQNSGCKYFPVKEHGRSWLHSAGLKDP